ncbi:MAG: NAD-dependent epimerase/dehydratase family protein, partial [Deltaproteobacteria bacterium]|nr:NAD-dependent epimerase/dehydratase family protein [Deltaproteobacteria bacterium]
MKVLVTGASGAVGPALVDVLLQKSSAVRVFTRKPPQGDLFPGTVECFQGDICDPDTVNRAVEGIDVVYHLAAKTHTLNPSRDLQGVYQHNNV